jgi:hypothetical protein
MLQRPRLLAASLCTLLVGLGATSCSLDVTYSSSHYACSSGACPSGYACVASFCEESLIMEDAAVGGADAADLDGSSMTLSIDGAPEIPDATVAPPDARPPPDAAPPPPDAAPPCVGERAVVDPSTGHCYIRVPPSLSFASAKLGCVQLGGHLATITSSSEQAVVASLNDNTIAEVWIGASDSAQEGDWRWIDNVDFPPSPSPNASSFQKWNTGEPNNNASSPGEDCAILELRNGGVWDDRSCSTTLSSVCERD